MTKPRYRWSYAWHCWLLQNQWHPLGKWPPTLMPVLVERRPGESDVSIAARWREHFAVLQ